MKRPIWIVACGLLLLAGPAIWGEEVKQTPATSPATSPSTRPEPKAISTQVSKGMKWLAGNQLPSGAWGQGDESQAMGGGQNLKSQPNVADTCMAVMALVRTGSSPKAGDYKDNVLGGVSFVCTQIENSDDKSLYVTELRSTRTQQKLGTYIDTFLAAQMLGELRKQMPDEASTKRVAAALDKALNKIEHNQKANGQWVNEGWAPALAQAAASKALNVAAQNGAKVDEAVRERAETFARGQAQQAAQGKTVEGTAGVKLYGAGGDIAAMQASDTTNKSLRAQADHVVANAATMPAEEVKKARDSLARYDANAEDLQKAQKAVVANMDDKRFMAGFGSNGGEEFLSYLNIGESLYIKGGDDWIKWDGSMTQNLNHIQNDDGSWSGDHCITGRTFCTSAALMVLTIDRAPEALGRRQTASC